MTMTEARSPGAPNAPAAALNSLDPETFNQFVIDSLPIGTDAAKWEALTDPRVIARTKASLTGLLSDVIGQLAEANARRQAAHGRRGFIELEADEADWRRRAIGFRRMVERRLNFVKGRLAVIHAEQPKSAPGAGKQGRRQVRRALETLARAVVEHRQRVMSGEGDEGDDERLWDHLTTVTTVNRLGEELTLAEWLEYLDDVRDEED